jgi:putative hydrolase of the HAD superfamily
MHKEMHRSYARVQQLSATRLKPHRHTGSWQRKSVRTLVFDGDDTLWQTQVLYEQAKDEFEAFLAAKGLADPTVRRKIDAVDAERVRLMGFSRERFPSSLLEVARDLAREGLISLRAADESVILAIGRAVFSRQPQPTSTAKRTLRKLRDRFRLILLTKGDRDVQSQRITSSGLTRSFDAIYISDRKDASTFRTLIRKERLNPSHVIVVGDSIPALKSGVGRAIWIPADVWTFETAGEPWSRRFLKLRSLSRLPQILD